MPILKKTMFRQYDLRGLEADDELNETSMYYIGRGFAKILHDRGINSAIVGHDARGTSESFHNQVIKGLTESGISVIDVGMVITPMAYWAQHHFKIRGLAMITASHNPAGWNGVKFGIDLSKMLVGDEIQELHQIIVDEDFIQGQGTVKKEEVFEDYATDIIERVTISKKFKVLLNTANGTAGAFGPKILKRVGCEIIEHNTNIDSTFPNYTADTDNKDLIKDTSEQVLKHNCQLGIVYDGDADRFAVFDEKGQIMLPDRYLILLARLVLKRHPGAKIIFDVKASEVLPEEIKAHGGVPIMYRTGHSYIKTKMNEEGAALAGEMSGHVFWADNYYGFDDGIFTSLNFLEYLSSQDKTLSELDAEIPTYPSTPAIHVKTTDEDKYKVIETLVQEFKDDGYKVIDTDGARVYIGSGWGLVRASNTTPTLTLRFEAKTHEELEKLQNIFKKKLDRFDSVDKEWGHSAH